MKRESLNNGLSSLPSSSSSDSFDSSDSSDSSNSQESPQKHKPKQDALSELKQINVPGRTDSSRDFKFEEETALIDSLKDVTFRDKQEFDLLVADKMNAMHKQRWLKSYMTNKYFVLKCKQCLPSKGFSVWFTFQRKPFNDEVHSIKLYRKIRLIHSHSISI